jgi:dTDP-4-dehydrorhamnose 3,5-epimerase-like enzyme
VKQGSILDIVLDIRLKSNTYGRVETIELDANDEVDVVGKYEQL